MQQCYFGWRLLQCLGLIAADKEEGVDYFGRLPDDIIVDIFVRVNDCKFLTQCLLLNKRFASLIRLVSSIRIHIPLMKKYDTEFVRCDYNNNLITTSQDIEFQSCWNLGKDNSFFIRKALEVLHPYSEVKSAIIVEYPAKFDLLSFRVDPNTLRWWMVEYSGGGVDTGFIKSCAFLRPIVTSQSTRDSRHIQILYTWVISDLFATAFTFYPVLSKMVRDHGSSCHILVTTTDSGKGWIHAGDDEIVKMRQADHGVCSTDKMMKTMRKEGLRITMKVKVWYDVRVPIPPGEKSSFYIFVVVSSPDNIDREVKAATSRFWDDCNYGEGRHHDDKMINMRELVEKRPCNLEFTWIASYKEKILS